MLPGVTIALAGRDWLVPPLTLGQLRRVAADIGRLDERSGVLDSETIGAVVRIVTAALQRNYPALDEQAVEEMIDLGNAGAVLNAVLAGSGLRRSALGEVAAAAGPRKGRDGTRSTASSPPPSATGRKTSTS